MRQKQVVGWIAAVGLGAVVFGGLMMGSYIGNVETLKRVRKTRAEGRRERAS